MKHPPDMPSPRFVLIFKLYTLYTYCVAMCILSAVVAWHFLFNLFTLVHNRYFWCFYHDVSRSKCSLRRRVWPGNVVITFDHNVFVFYSFRLEFEAIRAIRPYGDIALDDISFSPECFSRGQLSCVYLTNRSVLFVEMGRWVYPGFVIVFGFRVNNNNM